MPLTEPKYKYNQTILKLYDDSNGNKKIKVITMNVLRTAGVEDENEIRAGKGTVNDEKLGNNICRAKSNLFELAYCNPWEWYFTGTLRPEYDRTDLKAFHKSFTQWIRNYNRLHNASIKFLLIPELHKDGKSWHMHGFLMGLPENHLKRFVLGDKMGKELAKKVRNGDKVYNWLPYAKKFGFVDLEPIKSHESVSKYITKYISKELSRCVTEMNAHLYYCSRGLQRATVISKGDMSLQVEPTYTGDYCSIAWLDFSEELFEKLKKSIQRH